MRRDGPNEWASRTSAAAGSAAAVVIDCSSPGALDTAAAALVELDGIAVAAVDIAVGLSTAAAVVVADNIAGDPEASGSSGSREVLSRQRPSRTSSEA